jgi:hypothetical protein
MCVHRWQSTVLLLAMLIGSACAFYCPTDLGASHRFSSNLLNCADNSLTPCTEGCCYRPAGSSYYQCVFCGCQNANSGDSAEYGNACQSIQAATNLMELCSALNTLPSSASSCVRYKFNTLYTGFGCGALPTPRGYLLM